MADVAVHEVAPFARVAAKVAPKALEPKHVFTGLLLGRGARLPVGCGSTVTVLVPFMEPGGQGPLPVYAALREIGTLPAGTSAPPALVQVTDTLTG